MSEDEAEEEEEEEAEDLPARRQPVRKSATKRTKWTKKQLEKEGKKATTVVTRRTRTSGTIESDEEVQNMTVTSSNDYSNVAPVTSSTGTPPAEVGDGKEETGGTLDESNVETEVTETAIAEQVNESNGGIIVTPGQTSKIVDKTGVTLEEDKDHCNENDDSRMMIPDQVNSSSKDADTPDQGNESNNLTDATTGQGSENSKAGGTLENEKDGADNATNSTLKQESSSYKHTEATATVTRDQVNQNNEKTGDVFDDDSESSIEISAAVDVNLEQRNNGNSSTDSTAHEIPIQENEDNNETVSDQLTTVTAQTHECVDKDATTLATLDEAHDVNNEVDSAKTVIPDQMHNIVDETVDTTDVASGHVDQNMEASAPASAIQMAQIKDITSVSSPVGMEKAINDRVEEDMETSSGKDGSDDAEVGRPVSAEDESTCLKSLAAEDTNAVTV